MRFPFFARLALLFCLTAPALAQVSEAEADRRVAALAEELKSPFCPGKTLMTCTSNQAYTLRKEMHEMVLRGLSNDEVIAELKLRYGDEVENPPQPWYTFFVPLMPYLAETRRLAKPEPGETIRRDPAVGEARAGRDNSQKPGGWRSQSRERQRGTLLAAKKVPITGPEMFPYVYEVSSADVMMQGSVLAGKVRVEARADSDGDALSKLAGDLTGGPRATEVGQEGVDFVLDAVLP
jgi:hypothetical protein